MSDLNFEDFIQRLTFISLTPLNWKPKYGILIEEGKLDAGSM